LVERTLRASANERISSSSDISSGEMESDDGVVQAVGVPGMRALVLGWVESDLDDGIDKSELVLAVGPFGADKGGGGTEAVIHGPINRS
jgi:hypothetical protein